MCMNPEKRKSAVALILGKMVPKDETDESEPADGADMGLETAMSELISALKSGDAKAAATSFKAAYEQCHAAPEPEPEAPKEPAYDDDDEDDE